MSKKDSTNQARQIPGGIETAGAQSPLPRDGGPSRQVGPGGRNPSGTRMRFAKDMAFLTVGIILAAMAQAFFLIPNKIVPGGFAGIGTILYFSYHVPVGIFTIVINISLVFIQMRMLGLKSGARTVAAIVAQGILLDFMMKYMVDSPLASDPMLASLYGGLLTGVAVACIFKAGGTLGGTDIIAQLALRFKGIPAGTTLLWCDVVVLLLAAAVYGPDLALFALIKVYVTSQTLDGFMEGFSVNRQVMIISRFADTIAWGIIEELRRGVTSLQARGVYTGESTEVLVTAVRRKELFKLEELVYRIDPKAFLIITDARRVLGRGFDKLETIVGDLVEPEIQVD